MSSARTIEVHCCVECGEPVEIPYGALCNDYAHSIPHAAEPAHYIAMEALLADDVIEAVSEAIAASFGACSDTTSRDAVKAAIDAAMERPHA